MSLLVVLVRTHSPGNLGAAARAARNFDAGLVLVDPSAGRDHPDARAFTSGAEGVLDAAPVLHGLEPLRRRAGLLVALTSLRGRAVRGLPPAIPWSRLRAEGRTQRVALVFGPERGGLSTGELRQCDVRRSLPASPSFPTLNLAQAVAAALALAQPPTLSREENAGGTASSAETARLLRALRETLASAGYPGRGRSAEVLAELESFVRRGRPTAREVTLFLGALAALQRGLMRKETAGPSVSPPTTVQK